MATNGDILRALGNIEGKLDGFLEREAERDKRIAAVEKRQWYHTGGAAVIAFAFAKLGIPWPKLT